MNIFAHAGHDHAEVMAQGVNGTLVIAAAICVLIAGIVVFAFVYDVIVNRKR